jgi:protein-S-isoprenylcysteine O-methyltransferase Ste14
MSPPGQAQYLPGSGLRIGNVIASHRIVASRLIFVAFAAALFATESAHQGTLQSSVVLLVAVALAGVAAAGRAWCALHISGYKGAQLVTSGPYSICRNPLYLFSLLGMAGVGLASGSITLGVALPAAFLPVSLAVVRREEAFLRQRFGEQFVDYCERTPRLLPRLALLSEPAWYSVSPRIFRRALGDLIWFPWGVAMVQLVAALHASGLLPALLRLP